jgi:hypothetical protein
MSKITIISSQRYINDGIVEQKRESKDYVVALSPAFEIDGMTVQVVLDGHHSLEAARLDNVDTEYYEQNVRDNDTIALLDSGNIDDFMSTHRLDSDWYNVETGNDIW